MPLSRGIHGKMDLEDLILDISQSGLLCHFRREKRVTPEHQLNTVLAALRIKNISNKEVPADLILELRAVIVWKAELFVDWKLLISPGTVHTEEITHRIYLMSGQISGILGESGIAFRVIRVETLRSVAEIGDSHPNAFAER